MGRWDYITIGERNELLKIAKQYEIKGELPEICLVWREDEPNYFRMPSVLKEVDSWASDSLGRDDMPEYLREKNLELKLDN